jgi:hypothetical protein
MRDGLQSIPHGADLQSTILTTLTWLFSVVQLAFTDSDNLVFNTVVRSSISSRRTKIPRVVPRPHPRRQWIARNVAEDVEVDRRSHHPSWR